MSRIEEVIGDALAGIEMVRPGVVEFGKYAPGPAKIVGLAITVLYEGLVVIRAAAAHATPEEIRAAIAHQIADAIQDLAAAKFGAMPNQGDDPP